MKFTEEHEWVEWDGSVATVGITDYAVTQLGDLVFVELPEVGSNLVKGAAAAVVESVKTASEVFAPIAGEVVEINSAVAADPALVNSEPHGRGWLYRLRLANTADMNGLMDEAAYQALIG